jgi:hypothetical protein
MRTGFVNPGTTFQGENVASGVYYYVWNPDNCREVGKMTLLK